MNNKTYLVNAKQIISNAIANKFAIPHININNLIWAKAALEAAEEEKSPIIIAASSGAIKYMGGFNVVYSVVNSLVRDLKITVPVVLHLDHGNYDACLKAIDAGFSSIMFDGSSLPFEENYELTKSLVKLAKEKNISIEAEAGAIGGEEDNVISRGELADNDEALKLASLGVDILAVGIGNIHGKYPKNWKSLDFDKLTELNSLLNVGLVLHGGSGIPKDQIQKAIELGIRKINVNTELQLAFCEATKDFILSGKVNEGKNYDPRKLMADGYEAIKQTTKEKIREFHSNNKA